MQAVENINTTIDAELTGMNAVEQAAIDARLIELDGTENKKLSALDGSFRERNGPRYVNLRCLQDRLAITLPCFIHIITIQEVEH